MLSNTCGAILRALQVRNQHVLVKPLLATKTKSFSTTTIEHEKNVEYDFMAEDSLNDESAADQEKKSFDELRDRLLSNALAEVPLHGFTRKALFASADRIGMSQSLVSSLGESANAQLALHFYRDANTRLDDWMFEKLGEMSKEGVEKTWRQPDFIRDAVQHRLSYILPVRRHWMSAIIDLNIACYQLEALKCLQDLSHSIWWHAGDTSVDSNWYTKRIILGAIYKSTELRLLTDESEGQRDTWQFLDDRMKDSAAFGATIGKIKQDGELVSTIAQSLLKSLNKTNLDGFANPICKSQKRGAGYPSVCDHRPSEVYVGFQCVHMGLIKANSKLNLKLDMNISAALLSPSDLSRRGQIQVIYGPMFSGKTTELIRRVRRLQYAQYKCVLIKYARDTRYSGDDEVSSHDLQTLPAISCGSQLSDIQPEILSQYEVIAVDEGQFFEDIVSFAETHASDGKIVLVAALDGTYQRCAFGNILGLVPLAESVIKLSAVCMVCFQSAAFTKRISSDTAVEVIGGSDKYIAVCRKCFDSPCRQATPRKQPKPVLMKTARADFNDENQPPPFKPLFISPRKQGMA